MKKFYFLLLCLFAFNALAQSPAEVCGDGKRRAQGYCDGVLSAPNTANLSATGADGVVNLAGNSNGLQYGCVTTSSTPESAANLFNETGGSIVDCGFAAVSSTGSQTVSVGGLTAGQSYYFQFIQRNAAGWESNVVVSPQFTLPAALSTWLGVPNPSSFFGYDPLTIPEPADPASWPGSETVGQYYVDGGSGNCSDANTYGYPDVPRCTIPDGITLDGGDKVVIVGNGARYITGGDGRWQYQCTGTSAANDQAWVVGRGATNPKLDRELRIGSVTGCDHGIFSKLDFEIPDRPINIQGGNYVTYRDSVNISDGTNQGPGATVGISNTSYVVTANLEIGFWGNSEDAAENDTHAILPTSGAQFVWVLNNHIYNSGGDSIQVGQAQLAAGTWPENIFIAGNHFHDDRENAIDIKDATNVIISQNILHGYAAVSSSGGECIVVHDDANHIWILGNIIYDCHRGLSATADTDIYVFYNEFRDFTGPVDFGGPYHESNTVAYFSAITNLTFAFNTLDNYTIGVQATSGAGGTIDISHNIFNTKNNAGGWDVMIESTGTGASALIDSNLYLSARNRIGSTNYTGLAAWQGTGQGANSIENGAILFTNEAADDFTLQAGSPAIDSATFRPAVLADYVTDIGLAIEKDNNNNDRPAAIGDWDLGAYESGAGGGGSAFYSNDFDTDLAGLTTYLGNDSGGDLNNNDIEVTVTGGRYRAELKDNSSNQTLWFNSSQGRADGVLVTGDFEAIALNVGIGTIADSQTCPSGSGNPILFAGLNVHSSTWSDLNSAHLVAGHRNGDATFTIEGKNTVNSSSTVNDLDNNAAPNCRMDVRVVRTGSTLTWFYRLPGDSTWIAYTMPGTQFTLTPSVYVSLITYAQNSTGVPFVGTADSFEITLQ